MKRFVFNIHKLMRIETIQQKLKYIENYSYKKCQIKIIKDLILFMLGRFSFLVFIVIRMNKKFSTIEIYFYLL